MKHRRQVTHKCWCDVEAFEIGKQRGYVRGLRAAARADRRLARSHLASSWAAIKALRNSARNHDRRASALERKART
jgi:hypothetical protein